MSREDSERVQPSEKGSGTSVLRALTFSGVLAGGAAWVYVRYLSSLRPIGHDRWGLWPVIALGLWAGERSLVSVRNRRVSIEVSLSEIPVLLGIVFLQPALALSAVSCGYLASLVHRRRKVTNILTSWTAYLLAVSLGILAYDRWLGPGVRQYTLGAGSPVWGRSR